VHVGRHLVLDLDAKSEAEARTLTRQMCEKLLANPVTEDFEIATVATA
jgi:phosphoribosylformylglycinamidine synthase